MAFLGIVKCLQCNGELNPHGICWQNCAHFQQGSTSQSREQSGTNKPAPQHSQQLNAAPPQKPDVSTISTSNVEPQATTCNAGNLSPNVWWNPDAPNSPGWINPLFFEWLLVSGHLNGSPLSNPQAFNSQPPSPNILPTAAQHGEEHTKSPQAQHLLAPSAHTPASPSNGQLLMNGAVRGHGRRRSSISSAGVLPDPHDRNAALHGLALVSTIASQLSRSEYGDLDTPRPPIQSHEEGMETSSGQVNLCHDCNEWFLSFAKYRPHARINLGSTDCENCKRNGHHDRNIASVPAIRVIPPQSVERDGKEHKPLQRETPSCTQRCPTPRPPLPYSEPPLHSIPQPQEPHISASSRKKAAEGPFYCSIPTCNRSLSAEDNLPFLKKGVSFGRKDNRNEHEWRVHGKPKVPRGGRQAARWREKEAARRYGSIASDGDGPPRQRQRLE